MPDRLIPYLDRLDQDLARLTGEVSALRTDRDRDQRTAWFARIAIVLVLVACVSGFFVIRVRDTTERREARCTLYAARVEDHTVTIRYLRLAVGDSPKGERFVSGLESAYKADDAKYARKLDLHC